MAITNTGRRIIRPTHPGEMLREDFMIDYGLTVANLAKALGISRQSVNEVLRERRSITPAMALKLSKLFGNSAEFWLNAQRTVDLWEANRQYQEQIRRIKRILPQHPA
jgi:antitoxin HigA-1